MITKEYLLDFINTTANKLGYTYIEQAYYHPQTKDVIYSYLKHKKSDSKGQFGWECGLLIKDFNNISDEDYINLRMKIIEVLFEQHMKLCLFNDTAQLPDIK